MYSLLTADLWLIRDIIQYPSDTSSILSSSLFLFLSHSKSEFANAFKCGRYAYTSKFTSKVKHKYTTEEPVIIHGKDTPRTELSDVRGGKGCCVFMHRPKQPYYSNYSRRYIRTVYDTNDRGKTRV